MNKVLGAIILLFISFVLTIYFISPRYSKFTALSGKIPERETLLKENRNYIENVKATFDSLKEYSQALGKIEAALPQEISTPHLLSFFQKEVQNNGLILDSFNQVEVKTRKTGKAGEAKNQKLKLSEKVKESHFLVKVKGTLSSFENFLGVLEKSSRIFEIEKISLNNSGDNILEIEILIKVYSY
jgi:Tfp pilus assembly protein PilO